MTKELDSKIEQLMEHLWGRALDMTSPDFADDDDYLTAQTNYKKHCLKELTQLIVEAQTKAQKDILNDFYRIMVKTGFNATPKQLGKDIAVETAYKITNLVIDRLVQLKEKKHDL